MRCHGLLLAALVAGGVCAFGDLVDTLSPAPDHPAIEYYDEIPHPPKDAVSILNQRIAEGAVHLRFEPGSGYLRPLLEALHVPVESQLAVFSKTSLQAPLIGPENPRTIFFNDTVAVAWMRGGFIELASVDPERGVIFHVLEQRPAETPFLVRRNDCTRCHISDASLGVPGMMVRSRFTAPDGSPRLILGGYTTDHRSPFEERWGGWYVSGELDGIHHMGNTVYPDDDHAKTIPVQIGDGYLARTSDMAALLVFDHQMHMTNLLIRIGWETRAGLHDGRGDLASWLRSAAREFVDYLLFVDEVPLPGKIHSTSGFAERFAALGPKDSQGRSLRQLALDKRLMRYPCSYMIYTDAFDDLPSPARDAIYERMWQVLSGTEPDPKYTRLSSPDRKAIVEILRETKRGLPTYFRPVRK
jgi:hypothetical protein